MAKSTVKVTMPWQSKTQEVTLLDMAGIRIEIDEDEPERVWIWMIEDGIKVEGGSFSLDEFMNHIMNYYNGEY
jgi:hypothetical protein